MVRELVTISLGFIEGFALIISPCILPILPIILAGSLSGHKTRPFGIIIGFTFTFAIFTLFSRKLVLYSGVDLNIIRHISFGILLLLGLIMLSSYLSDKFSQLTARLTQTGSRFAWVNNPQGGLLSGLIFGGLIAMIWTPCAGPILAAVIVQTVIQQTSVMSLLILLAFGIGVAVPMLLIALFGREITMRVRFFKKHARLFRKFLGLIIILAVAAMLYFEGEFAGTVSTIQTNRSPVFKLEKELPSPYLAPSIGGITAWINSKPLQLKDLQGKVVLIDFWTYSCINCIRTLPYLKTWYSKFHHQGLVVIGIHAPEFDFEKDLNNVKDAVVKYGIKYPVALDNGFVSWRNFQNRYWPAHYLIDKEGRVIYAHFGEGDYDVTENNIRYLLGLRQAGVPTNASRALFESETPETYLGYARAERFASPQAPENDRSFQYTFPPQLVQNAWALQGNWKILSDRIISDESNAAIEINFHARKVFMVMGNVSAQPVKLKLILNGKEIASSITVDKHMLYSVLALNQSSQGILQAIASAPGLEIYTFTFGE